MVNGYGLLDRDMYLNERQISQGLLEQKEMLLRERSRSEMLMRQNELLARQHAAMMEPKHYMPAQSIPLDSATDLLGEFMTWFFSLKLRLTAIHLQSQ